MKQKTEMKKKITYILLTILLLSGVFVGLRLGFGLFTPFNYFTARQDISNGNIKIIQLGELPFNYKQRRSLANSYGFNLYFNGCNITTEIVNGTKYYNKEVISHLTAKLGKNWWSKFENQLDSIDKVNEADPNLDKVFDLVFKQKIVENKMILIDSLSKGHRQIYLIPSIYDSTKNIYLVTVGENNGTKKLTYFDFLVDSKTMTIINPTGNLK